MDKIIWQSAMRLVEEYETLECLITEETKCEDEIKNLQKLNSLIMDIQASKHLFIASFCRSFEKEF